VLPWHRLAVWGGGEESGARAVSTPREGLRRRSGAAPARDMKGVSWTRGRAIHVDDQGSSGAFPEREDNLEKQLALWKRGGAARVEDKIRSSLW